MNENDPLSKLNNCLTKPIAERKLSPHEIGNLIKTANQTHSLLKISEVMNLKDKNFLNRFIKILDLPSEIQQKITWKNNPGTISFTQSFVLASEPNSEKKQEIFNLILNKENFTRIEINKMLY